MSQSTKDGPKHLASSKQFLVINQDNDTKQDDSDPNSASSGKSTSADTPRGASNSLPSRSIGQKRNFFLDARDVYSAYQPNQVIGQNIFRANLYAEMKTAVLRSKAVQDAMAVYAAKNPTVNTSRIKTLATSIADKLMAAPRDKLVRSMVFTVQKILQRLYKTINVVDSQIAELKRVAAEAAERKVPLVILPSHKSHVDYLVISWLMFHIGVSVPFVASGDNLMMPIVGSLLRGSGAFFIRRSFGEDGLYRAILTEYMTVLLEKACNIEFFIEGGRSRSGKLLSPKMGLLTVVTDAFFAGRINDAYIVPVSIGYEKVIETEGYIQELLGKSKQPETLVQVIQAVELLKLNFGSVDIRFDKPFSLKSFVQGQVESRNLNLFNLEQQPLQKETILRDRRQVVNILAYFVAYHINCVSVALPTSLIVTTLLTHHGRGISKSALLEKVSWLREQVQLRGGHVAHSSEDLSKTIDQVTLLLGSSITRHSNLLEPIFTPTKRFELSYYRNQIIHLFVPEAIVACSIYPFRQRRKINLIPLSELESSAKYLSRLLKWEFIFRSSPDFAENLTSTIEWMKSQGALAFDSHTQLVSVLRSGEDLFQFLCFLLWPFVEAYWMVSASLFALWPDKMVEESDFLTNIQKFASTLYYEGELGFFESISKEMTKSALTRFIERQVITRSPVSSRTVIVKLTPQYQRDRSKLVNLVQKIGSFRRHGKYSREEGASERIEHLAAMLTASSSVTSSQKAKL